MHGSTMVQKYTADRPDAHSPPDRPAPDRNRLPWRDIARRGGALGMAVALHLSLLTWILTLTPAPDAKPANGEGEPVHDDALHLTFLHKPAATPATPVTRAIAPRRASPSPRMAATPRRERSPSPAPLPAQASSNPPMHIDLSPAPDDAATYHPGNFRGDLQEARHPRPAFRMPGFAGTRVPGIHLRTPPASMKKIVRMIGKSQDCYAAYTGITHGMARFLTPDQIDSKMEAEGCGPQASKEDNDPTINAIAHGFVTGH